jgi:toxin CcdB
MAQFDVFRHRNRAALVVDCQSNFCDFLDTRFVVPLVRVADNPPQLSRLNPQLEVEGMSYVLVPNAAATLAVHELGNRICSLASDQEIIKTALDQLITGF